MRRFRFVRESLPESLENMAFESESAGEVAGPTLGAPALVNGEDLILSFRKPRADIFPRAVK